MHFWLSLAPLLGVSGFVVWGSTNVFYMLFRTD